MKSVAIYGVIGLLGVFTASSIASPQQVHVAEARRSESGAEVVFNRLVTVRLDGVTLRNAVDAIAASAKVKVQYRRELLASVSTPVTLHVSNLPLGVTLSRVLSGTGLQVVALDADLIGVTSGASDAQAANGIITGRVVFSGTKKPAKNVAILLDDQTRGVTTNEDGQYRISAVSAGRHRVTMRLVGYVKFTGMVTVKDDETTTLNVSLDQSVNALDQVVVTGNVGAVAQREISNAVTVIDAKQIEARNITRLDQLFRGDIPGLFMPQLGVAPKNITGGNYKYGTVQLFSRGSTVLSTTTNDGTGDATTNSPTIKTYVDGILMADPDYLNQIDPKSIDRIEIISGPQASTLYGSEALSGVMQIFTKRGYRGQRPELTASLQYGTIENNFSSSLAPRHNDNIQLTDAVGPISYNIGGTYSYDGQWTPGNYTRSWGGYGGGRREAGPLTVDVTARATHQIIGGAGGSGGSILQALQQAMADGSIAYARDVVLPAPHTKYDIVQNTYGTTVGYTPFRWFRNNLTVGVDQSTNGSTEQGARYTRYYDSSNVSRNVNVTRALSMSFNTTLDNNVGPFFHSTFTAGLDLRRTSLQRLIENGDDISNFSGVYDIRTRDKSRGYFGQWLLGLQNTVFLTLALRAEESPNYGPDHKFDYSPRYGLSAVHDIGSITAKARFTDGRSTRAPGKGLRDQIGLCDDPSSFNCTYLGATYGSNVLLQRANRDLQPESQRGPEYGLDLFFGNRASLSLTAYKQRVLNLISAVTVDSVMPLDPNYGPYPYYTTANVNIGDIKNTGILSTATVSFGLVTMNATYSWTKSRIARLAPGYTGAAQVGDAFQGGAEHTGALTGTYANATTTLSATLNYTGQILEQRSVNGTLLGAPRTGDQYSLNATGPFILAPLTPSAQLALNGSRVVSRSVTMFFNVMNAGNYYRNEGGTNIGRLPVMGRQSSVGVRLRY